MQEHLLSNTFFTFDARFLPIPGHPQEMSRTSQCEIVENLLVITSGNIVSLINLYQQGRLLFWDHALTFNVITIVAFTEWLNALLRIK